MGVEADELVGLHARFHDPHPVAVVRHHRVGPGRGAGRQRPLAHLVGGRVEAAEVAAGVVTVPQCAVGRERDPARPRRSPGQLVFRELERTGIHRPELVGPEQVEPRPVGAVDDEAVGARVGRRHAHQADLTARHGELAHDVAGLRGKPDVPVAVEGHRVGVADRAVGQRKTGDVAVARVQPPDVAHQVPREPHDALRIYDQVVRSGPRVEIVAPELVAAGVEYRDIVAFLADEPDPAVARDVRVAWPGVRPRYRPFIDRGLLGGKPRGRNEPERGTGQEGETGDHGDLH